MTSCACDSLSTLPLTHSPSVKLYYGLIGHGDLMDGVDGRTILQEHPFSWPI